MATALFVAGNSSNAFLILQTRDVGVSLETTILIYAAFNLVAALISYPAGALSDRWGRRNILLAAIAVFFAAYLGFALTRNVLLIGALFVLYGLYQGAFRAVGKALALRMLVPRHLRASGVGGTAPRWACGSLWQALSPDRCGTASATLRCSISARCSPPSGSSPCSHWCPEILGHERAAATDLVRARQESAATAASSNAGRYRSKPRGS